MTPADVENEAFLIDTEVEPDALRDQLRVWSPWHYPIEFSGGVSTTEFERAEPFVDRPLALLQRVAEHLPEGLEGSSALDIGCAIGLRALELSRRYGLDVTGVDAVPRNIEIARYLAEVGGFGAVRFHLADPNHFLLSERFALVLHLETLELLRDPFLALRNAVQMLTPGGCLVLEHGAYRDPQGDETLCRFAPHAGPQDQGKPWWWLGAGAVTSMLRSAGCSRIEELEASPEADGVYRRVVIAYRPAPAPAPPLAPAPPA